MSKRSDQGSVEQYSGWGYVSLLAIGLLVCCAGPVIAGALGVMGATWLGGATAGIFTLTIVLGWRVSRRKIGQNSAYACYASRVTLALPNTPPNESTKTKSGSCWP